MEQCWDVLTAAQLLAYSTARGPTCLCHLSVGPPPGRPLTSCWLPSRCACMWSYCSVPDCATHVLVV